VACAERAAGPTHRDDRPIARQLAGALGQFAERDKDRAADMSKGPGELLRLAHIEDLNGLRMLLQPVGIDFPDTGKRVI